MSFFNDESSKLVVLVDIGSGSLTASLVLCEKNNVPVFLYTKNQSFVVTEKPDSHVLVQNMLKSLDEVFLDILKTGLQHKKLKSGKNRIYNVVLSFSSPWFMQKTKYIEISESTPFIVTESFVKQLTTREENVFIEEIKKDHGEQMGDAFEVVENNIVNIKVNGYVINKIIGQKVNSLNAYLCMSLIGKDIMDKVYDLVTKHTHQDRKQILVHTFPLISFSVFRDLFNQYRDFVMLDITSEVTDITLVSNDIIVGTISIPLGRNFIVRKIAKEFAVPCEIAESNLVLYSNKVLDKDTSGKIESVLVEIEKEWAIFLEKTLLELSPELALPNRLYMTSSQDISEIFTNYLKVPKADATASFRKGIEIIKVDEKILATLYKNDSYTLPNEFISLLAVFYDKLFLNAK